MHLMSKFEWYRYRELRHAAQSKTDLALLVAIVGH